MRVHGHERGTTARRGSVLVISLVTVATLAIFGLALLTAGMSGTRTVNYHDDDYRLSSAVESVAILAAEDLWSDYWNNLPPVSAGEQGGIDNFRAYLDGLGIVNNAGTGPPDATDGQSILATLALPASLTGAPSLNDVNIDAVQIFRRDVGDSTQLYLTVSATTSRGVGFVNPVLNRAVQQVYTVEPTLFEGFEYGILANNVNCIFCHTQIDATDRYYNTDVANYGDFERVKVGTLESLMLRHDMDGNSLSLTDYDADSLLAGTLYTRGPITDHHGTPTLPTAWSDFSMHSVSFDSTDGKVWEDGFGMPLPVNFSPVSGAPSPFENLYVDYPTDYTFMLDGKLPKAFPPPIPDDGGIDPVTMTPTAAGADNKAVDDEEFFAASRLALGAITAGFINVSQSTSPITTIPQYSSALTAGNLGSVQQTVAGNLILTGTINNPITVDGVVAVDGDVIINGYVKGSGTLLVRGNVYVPTDVQYLDGVDANGNRTFGLAADGTENMLGISAGGNVMVGDYLKPTTLKPDHTDPNWAPNLAFTYNPPPASQYVSGSDVNQGSAVGDWSFSLAEMSLFNRGEWMKTQPKLPQTAAEALAGPAAWTYDNSSANGGSYEPGYLPRYYAYGPGDKAPIYNGGDLHFDPSTKTWVHGTNFEVPLEWDPTLVNDATTFPGAQAVSTISPTDGWITEEMYKASVNYFENNRPAGLPLQLDALVYTNNAIFGIVNRLTSMQGQMLVNGALVCADLGLLVPGQHNPAGSGTSANVPGSPFKIGLRLNYDRRVRDFLTIPNPNQVELKRTLWNPTSNIL